MMCQFRKVSFYKIFYGQIQNVLLKKVTARIFPYFVVLVLVRQVKYCQIYKICEIVEMFLNALNSILIQLF